MLSRSLVAHLGGFLFLVVGLQGVLMGGTISRGVGLGFMILGALLIGAGFILAALDAIEEDRFPRLSRRRRRRG